MISIADILGSIIVYWYRIVYSFDIINQKV